VNKGAETGLNVRPGGVFSSPTASNPSYVETTGTVVTLVLAPGGAAGASQATNSANGAGGTTQNGTAVGTTLFAGGNGGTGNFTSGVGGSGAGGGAAGPAGVGGAASGNTAGVTGGGVWATGLFHSGGGAAGVGNSTPGATGGGGNYGGGGSGGKANSGADQAGGNGASGIVVLSWLDPITTSPIASGTSVSAPAVAMVGDRTLSGQTVSSTAIAQTGHTVVLATQVVALPLIYSTARAARYTETLLIENPTGLGGLLGITVPGINFWQTILGSSGGLTITSISLLAVTEQNGALTPRDALYLEIRDSTMTGTLLGTSLAMPGTSVPTAFNSWLNFPLPGGIAMVGGTTYWIGIGATRTATEVPNYAYVQYSTGNLYGSGELKNGSGGTHISGADLAFQLYTGTGHLVVLPGVAQSVTGTTITSGAILRTPTVAFPSTGGIAVNLLAYWACEEASGTRVDAVSGTYNLTDNNTVGSATGKIGTAADFEADNSEFLSNTSGIVVTGTWTISLWLKPETLPADYQAVFSRDDSAGAPLRHQSTIYLTPAGKMAVYVDPGNVHFDPGVTVLSVGNWYHLVVTFDTSGVGLVGYINGSVEDTVASPGFSDNNSVPFNVGKEIYLFASGRYFDGLIDEIGFWQRALTSTEVAWLYNAGSGRSYADLIGGGGPADQGVTTSHRLSTAVLNPATVAGGTLAISVPIIVGSAGDVLLEDGFGLLQEDGSALLLEGGVGLAQVFAPGVAQTGAPQSVTGVTLASTAVVNVPSIAAGPVAVTGVHRATTIQVFAPTVAPGAVTITGVHRATTIQVNAPTVTALLTGATITSGSGAFAPSVAQTVVAAHRATTAQTFAPTLTQNVTTVFRASTAQMFTASVAAGPVGITTATRPTTLQLNAPTVAPGPVGVGGPTLASTVQCFAAAITTGAVTVVGATIAATLVLFAPTLTSVAPGGVGAGTVASTVVVNAPSVVGGLATILPPAIASTSLTRPPSVTVGATSVLGGTLAPTSVLRAPTVIVGPASVTGATRPSTALIFAPTVTALLTGVTIPSGSGLFAPTLLVGQAVTTAHRATTLALTAPSVSPGPVTLTTPFRATTAVLNAPTVAALVTGVGTGTIASGVFLNAPAVASGAVTVGGVTIASTTQIHAPLVAHGLVVEGATIASTAVLFPPTLEVEIWTGALPPAIASGVTVRQLVIASAVTSALSVTGTCVVRQSVQALAITCTQSVLSDGTTVRVRQLVTSTDIEGWRP
jgi:hypothetical protein